ncbi:MAG: hypothetical protein R3291_03305 [Thermoplasmata archaeon]|nr:hypothetical protein [Thermoplasmata archaeon]
MERGLQAFLYVLIGVVAPLLVVLLNVLFDLVGIVLTIAMIVWMGLALTLMGPLLS